MKRGKEGGFTEYKAKLESRGTNRNKERVIYRLRLGHMGLNAILYMTGKHAMGRCSCWKSETLELNLFECEKHEAKRRQLVRKLKSTRSQFSVDIQTKVRKKRI